MYFNVLTQRNIPPMRNKTWEICCFQEQLMYKQLGLKGFGPRLLTAVLLPHFFLDLTQG